MNPLEILILFFSMTFLSAMLDESGFFEWLASKAADRAKGNQFVLFLLFTLLSGILTVFTSNDIVIITLTPFLIAFCRKTDIDPVPYLVSEFVSANTYSMLLIIGNPTNIYLSSAENIGFLPYLQVMALPTLFAGVTSFALLFLLFHKKLRVPFRLLGDERPIKDRFLFVSSFTLLSVCTVLMAVSSYLRIPMWMISLGAAVLLLVLLLGYFFFSKKSAPSYRRGETPSLFARAVPVIHVRLRFGVRPERTDPPDRFLALFVFLSAIVLRNRFLPLSQPYEQYPDVRVLLLSSP